MFSLISSDRRAIRFSAFALASAALLAACNSDIATAPNQTAAAKVPARPAQSIRASTALIINVVDQTGSPVTTLGSQFTIVGTAGIGYFGVDNVVGGDTDPTIGTIERLNLPAGKYKVCQTVAPTGYVMDIKLCKNITLGSAPVSVKFTNLTMPHMAFAVVDVNGNTVGGATITIDDGSGPVKVLDNSPDDLDPNPGRFEVKTQPSKSFSACPTAAPAGFVFTGNAVCVGAAATAGQTTFVGMFEVKPI